MKEIFTCLLLLWSLTITFAQDTTTLNIFLCPGDTFLSQIINNDTLIYENGQEVTCYNIDVFELLPITFHDDTLLCVGSSGLLSVNDFNAYHWSTGAMTQSISISNPGVFNVTATDFNGCTSSSAYQVKPYSIETNITSKNPTCPNAHDGYIQLLDVDTFQGALYYYLNDLLVEDFEAFNQLPADHYTILIQDEKGCSYLDSTDLVDPTMPIINVLLDTLPLIYGTPGQIETQYDNSFFSFEWSPSQGVVCVDCPQTQIQTDEANWYYLSGTTSDGCLVTDSIFVIGKKEVPIFIPNVFSPLSEQNGIFRIEGPLIIDVIKTMQIYDRWGNLLFNQHEINPILDAGWDGNYQGIPCPNGTYLVLADILLNNGETVQIKQGLTIMK